MSEKQPKQYKLLKDLPGVKAGTVYELLDIAKGKGFYPTNNCGDYTILKFGVSFQLTKDFIEHNPKFFEPIQETKPILKHPNGAVVEGLEDEKEYRYIDSYGRVHRSTWENYSRDNYRLLTQNIFLTKEEVEKALHQIEVRGRLLQKIKQIDFENGWEVDWSDENQPKYWISMRRGKKEYNWVNSPLMNESTYMSEQAKDYMMSDEVSDEELRLFLGIFE